MKKKALLVTTVSGFVPQFEMNNVKILQEMGYEVHYAANYKTPSYGTDNRRLDGTEIVRHQVDFVRSPYDIKGNITAYRQLFAIMQENKYHLVHCHTPMGSVLARIAAHRTRTGPVIYTAHGFHFFKGAPFKNWLIYYTMEKLLSHWTNQQICINQEDFNVASKKFSAQRVDYIPGVGIRTEEFEQGTVDQKQLKSELGISEDTQILLSVGELIPRKNHETIIRMINQMKDRNVVYLICGHGKLDQKLRQLAESLGVKEKVKFLGYRKDVRDICKITDVFLFPSLQEGLPIALLEAVASGVAAVVSDIRGNNELIEEGKGGFLVAAKDIKAFQKKTEWLLDHPEERKNFGEYNKKRAQQYDISMVDRKMREIYRHWCEIGKESE